MCEIHPSKKKISNQPVTDRELPRINYILPLQSFLQDLRLMWNNKKGKDYNGKKKFTLYIKVYKTENDEVHFRLRDAQALGPISNEAETKITQTSLEQFFRKTK